LRECKSYEIFKNAMLPTKPLQKISLSLLATASLLFGSGIAVPPALAQRLVNVNPGLDSEGVPPDAPISGVFDKSGGAAVDVRSVKIYVNDRDVTTRSTITPDFFSYRPETNLPAGYNTVRIEYGNNQGQNRRATWSFSVQQPQAALEITSVTHNAGGVELGAGATFLITINGTPNARASVILLAEGKTVRELTAEEVSRGVYVATVTVPQRQAIREGAVVARLQRGERVTYSAASQPFSFNPNAISEQLPEDGTGLDRPGTGTANTLEPVFTNYQDGDRVTGRGLVLMGQTLPNARVEIEVISQVSILGGIVNIGGNSLLKRIVTADRNGNFQVQVPQPSSPTAGMRYIVRAVASDGRNLSRAVTMTLIQQ
jgi:hypothetical protein